MFESKENGKPFFVSVPISMLSSCDTTHQNLFGRDSRKKKLRPKLHGNITKRYAR